MQKGHTVKSLSYGLQDKFSNFPSTTRPDFLIFPGLPDQIFQFSRDYRTRFSNFPGTTRPDFPIFLVPPDQIFQFSRDYQTRFSYFPEKTGPDFPIFLVPLDQIFQFSRDFLTRFVLFNHYTSDLHDQTRGEPSTFLLFTVGPNCPIFLQPSRHDFPISHWVVGYIFLFANRLSAIFSYFPTDCWLYFPICQ